MTSTDWCLAGVDCPPPTKAQFARGKILFDSQAGGVGCAHCHGPDGRGSPERGVPPNRGKTATEVKLAIAEREPMDFLQGMPDEDIEAVAAYLQILALEPAPEASPSGGL